MSIGTPKATLLVPYASAPAPAYMDVKCLMQITVTTTPEAEEHVRFLADASSNGEPTKVAELIYGRFDNEPGNYFNLAFPVDYLLNPETPYFTVSNVRIVVPNTKLATSINNKKLVLKDGNLEFE